MKNYKIIAITSLFFIAIATLVACNNKINKEVTGFAPIYLPLNQIYVVDVVSPQNTQVAGKIFQYGTNLTLQVDVNRGVHVIDCSDATNPIKLKFISIPGVTEITVKDNTLIANNYNDLVSIDLSDLNSISLASRTKDVYVMNQGYIPAEANSFFECPDEKRV